MKHKDCIFSIDQKLFVAGLITTALFLNGFYQLASGKELQSEANSQLFYAAETGRLSEAMTALANGADIDARNLHEGITSVWAASQNGHLKMVKFLLESGARIDEKDNTYGVTALWIAAQNGHMSVVKLLLDKGANIEAKDIACGITPLWMACQEADVLAIWRPV